MPQSTSRVGIGAIGFGVRLRQVVGMLLAQDPRIELHAICDPNPDAAKLAREQLGAEPKVVADYHDLVKDPDLDWVFVGSWNKDHATHAIAALDAGKNVFCEKPLATTLDDCLRVRDAIARSGRTFCFGLVMRYSPHYQKVHELLAGGQIGRLVSFEFSEALEYFHGGFIFGNWRRRTEVAGSHMLEKCCHDLDLANWMTGSLPVRVASFGGRNIYTPENAHLLTDSGTDKATGKASYRKWFDPNGVDPFTADGDLLDNQVVILEYANGTRATFHTNTNAAIPERRMYLLGTEGTLRAEAYSRTIELQRIGEGESRQTHSVPAPGTHAGGDAILAPHLAAMLLEGKQPRAGIHEAITSAAVAFAIDQAQTTGQVVDLRPIWRRAGIELSPTPV